jgi:dolichol-phosphate mannosyltransferase
MTNQVRLSVVVPVYSEEKTVAALVRQVRAVPLDTEIIAVDDGSTDNSPRILETVLEVSRNRVTPPIA